MPQISLNLDLTDEQYRELMELGRSTILQEKETQDAIRDILVGQMSEYLKQNTQLIEKCFHNYSYYGYKEDYPNSSTQKIIQDAAKDCSEELKQVVKDYMMDIAKTDKLDNYLHLILSEAVLIGCVSSIEGWRHEITRMRMDNECDIRKLKDRLGMSDY